MHQGSQSIESIAHDEGRFLAVQSASGTEFIDTWHVRDYLGSVRAVYDITPESEDVTSAGSQILEQNDRKGKEALDKAQLNVQNSFKENFPDPDNFDPNDGPKFRNGTNGALILGMLALIGNCSNPDDMKDDNDNSEQSTEVIIKPSDGQDSVNNEDKSKFEQIWDFFVKYLTY